MSWRGYECGTVTGRGCFLTEVTFSFWGWNASARDQQHAHQSTARTRWRPTLVWDSLLAQPSQNVKDETLLKHKVCHGIDQSFRHGCTRAAGPAREQTHPLTPKQEVLLTSCILGNSKERISLQHPGRCRKTRQSLLTRISRTWCLLRLSPF